MAKDINRISKIQKMPLFNKQALLEEDAANEGLDIPFRFGKGFDTDITLSDGNWTNVKNGRLWSIEFESTEAYSINFVFNDFYSIRWFNTPTLGSESIKFLMIPRGLPRGHPFHLY